MRALGKDRSRPLVGTLQSQLSHGFDSCVQCGNRTSFIQMLVFDPNAESRASVDEVLRTANTTDKSLALRLGQSERLKLVAIEQEISAVAGFVAELHNRLTALRCALFLDNYARAYCEVRRDRRTFAQRHRAIVFVFV